MASSTDPYFVVKEEVENSIANAERLYARWQRMFTSRSADDAEFKHTTEQLKTNIKSIEWDLEDLAETVSIAMREPHKFNLSQSELSNRNDFIETSKQKLKALKDGTSDARIKAKQEKDQRSDLMGRSKYSRYEKLEREIQAENQGFIDDQQQSQQMVMREQDTQLQEVGQTIGVLKNMGIMIGDELDEQNDMLEEMDEEMTSTSDRLRGTLKKLDRTLAITRDGKQSCCICLLLLTLIVLIIVYVSK
ncbi:hypothetical protein PTSG_00414 [Salpingoeca rosetta]|uniref:t-SNARE coiled-coil homology domain-containing protein n=1 Tax=Salpingoeca rosetta (strain ATCC 50818 / BSB-021) TaxID=946362 RepID=F2TWE8_SALR5|nr:uncharacterized protein PTSG_00414 [Salpingoeca rosetta]EGD72394.1 hypothetical protein PTSG_00414 [Salpingoeca rosetta]|eukprot:XP_004998963.1 hypothetical protein PTSG_00414 [Salpingoeca rosetta]